jgi:hypothetical protein
MGCQSELVEDLYTRQMVRQAHYDNNLKYIFSYKC